MIFRLQRLVLFGICQGGGGRASGGRQASRGGRPWAGGRGGTALLGEVHLAQVVSVGPLGDEGRITEGTLDH